MAADMVKDYGAHGDLTAEISTLGKHGQYPNNNQRDFKTWLKTLDGLPTSKIKCTMKRTDAVGTHIIDHEIIWPFDLVGAAYDELPRDMFEQTFMGPQGRGGVQEFWDKQASQPWVQKHPGLQPCPIPSFFRLAILWNPGLAIAIAKASWDHLAYPWISMDIHGYPWMDIHGYTRTSKLAICQVWDALAHPGIPK